MANVGGLWRWVWADFGFWLILDFSYGGSGLVGWLVLGFGYGCRRWATMGNGGGGVLWAVVVGGCAVYITV